MDRFLNLPDIPLLTIVSFLPFKEAAGTSIFSKRWSGIWRSTRNIEFNEHFFANADANRNVRRQIFIEFVKNWIENCPQPSIDKLSLTLSQPINFQGVVEDSLTFALARNVKHLVLDFSDPTWNQDDLGRIDRGLASIGLPLSFYDYQVLESLTLISCNFNVNGFRNFWFLKNLSLGWIKLPDSTLKALLVNCGCLESLSLKSCWNEDGLYISGRDLKLRTLVVFKCMMFTNPYLEIEAPNLKFLKYSGTPAVFDVNRTYLDEAEFDFGLQSECDASLGDILCQSLEQISPMRLTVCSYMLQVAPMSPDNVHGIISGLSTTHLTMKTAMHDYEQYGIRFFLRSCPCLETLTIEIGPARILYDDYEAPGELNPQNMWILYPRVFRCITRSLREVKVKGFKGRPNEMFLLHYLVQYGRVMEKLTLITSREENSHENPENYRLRAEQVRIVKRASQNLQITVT